MELNESKRNLFKKVRSRLGAPIRPVEITDNQFCDLLEMCVDDYAEKVQNWIISNQWPSLLGKKLSSLDLVYGLTMRTLDMTKDYSYWFSKEVGLQQRGPWELKKDFFKIEKGKQVYTIPAGREINKVLYMTPPTTQAALYANYAGLDIGFGMGFGQIGSYAGGGMAGYYIAPAYDVALLSTDLAYKNRLLRSDLIYKVTAGPEGTRLIHLLSTPGSKFTFGYSGVAGEMYGLVGCNVWYTYYDASGENVDECRLDNPDVLISPDQVPLNKMDYDYLNSPTQTIIRQLLVAKAASTIGLIRGYASGKISIPKAEMQLDYNMFINLGEKEEEKAMKSLEERLKMMDPYAVMEKQKQLVNDMMEAKRGVPLGIYVI